MIISASRRTDIPAFYSDWFFNRLRDGYTLVPNPMNSHQIRRIELDPDSVDCFVFWSKNPAPLLARLHELKPYPYYFQFTVNGYGADVEPNVPPLEQTVSTFRRLAEKIGPEAVIWRYDPICLSPKYNLDFHLKNFTWIARQLAGSTRQCTISFLDLYRKIGKKLARESISAATEAEMYTIAGHIAAIGKSFGLSIKTCCEPLDFSHLGIQPAACIDGSLISRLTGRTIDYPSDKNQRPACHCMASADIGMYNTCYHGCIYCYANTHPIEKMREP